MSVIIRLQNLPWSANAADIRSYFQGLSIPEGGVHIVGGEQGDAFIAFSTDEDARQGMLLDGGKLKEVKIKLLLSSRTQMLRVIEQARQQALKLQNLMSVPPQPLVPPMQTPVSNVTEEKKLEPEALEEKKDEETGSATGTRRDSKDGSRRDRDRSSSRDRKRSRDRSSERGRSRDRSRDRGRDRRDRDRDRRRRDRSRDRSRDRYRSRRSRSYERKRSDRDKDRYGRDKKDGDSDKRNSSDKNDRDKKGNINRDDKPDQQPQKPQTNNVTQPSQGKGPVTNIQQESNAASSAALSPRNNHLPDPPAIPQMLLQFQQNGKESPKQTQPQIPVPQANMLPPEMQGNPNFGYQPAPFNSGPGGPQQMEAVMNQSMKRESWPPMGGMQMPMMNPGVVMPPRGPMMGGPDMPLPGYGPGYPMMQPGMGPGFQPPGMLPGFPGMPGDMWRMGPPMQQPMGMQPHMQPQRMDIPTSQPQPAIVQDMSVEIRGLPSNASYVDIKRLFDGCTIPGDGIKMINDNHGYRTGIAYVKFIKPEHIQLALNQDGQKVRGTSVEILSLRDSIFDRAIDNFKPEKEKIKEVEMEIEDEDDRKRNKDSSRLSRESVDPRLQRTSQPSAFTTDSMKSNNYAKVNMKTNIVVIKGTTNASDRDIHDFFSEVGVSPININFLTDSNGTPNGDIECVFENDDEADKAATKHNSYLGRCVVTVEKIPRKAPTKETRSYDRKSPPKRSDRTESDRPSKSSRDSRDRRDRDRDRDRERESKDETRPPRRERGPRVSRFDKPREELMKPSQDEAPDASRVSPPIRDPRRAPLLQDPPTMERPARPDRPVMQNEGSRLDNPMMERHPMDNRMRMDRMGPPMGRMMDQMHNDRGFMERGGSRFPSNGRMGMDGMMDGPLMDGPPVMDGPPMERPPRGRHPNRHMGPMDGSNMGGPMDGPFPQNGRFNRRPGDDNGPNMMDWPERGDPRNRMDGSGRSGRGDRRDPRGGDRMGPRGGMDSAMDRRMDDRFSHSQDPRNRGHRGPPMLQDNMGPMGPMAAAPTFIDNESVDCFGQPGCVVALENVNFRADIDDILQFFCDFDIGNEEVIRRFDDSGRPTGDARVSFKSPMEAARAVDVLNHKPLLGRPVNMFVL